MRKKFLKTIFAILILLVSGLLGWVAGATIGGNYAEQFTFNGLRGYEATGQIGFILGIFAGMIICWLLFRRKQ